MPDINRITALQSFPSAVPEQDRDGRELDEQVNHRYEQLRHLTELSLLPFDSVINIETVLSDLSLVSLINLTEPESRSRLEQVSRLANYRVQMARVFGGEGNRVLTSYEIIQRAYKKLYSAFFQQEYPDVLPSEYIVALDQIYNYLINRTLNSTEIHSFHFWLTQVCSWGFEKQEVLKRMADLGFPLAQWEYADYLFHLGRSAEACTYQQKTREVGFCVEN